MAVRQAALTAFLWPSFLGTNHKHHYIFMHLSQTFSSNYGWGKPFDFDSIRHISADQICSSLNQDHLLGLCPFPLSPKVDNWIEASFDLVKWHKILPY